MADDPEPPLVWAIEQVELELRQRHAQRLAAIEATLAQVKRLTEAHFDTMSDLARKQAKQVYDALRDDVDINALAEAAHLSVDTLRTLKEAQRAHE